MLTLAKLPRTLPAWGLMLDSLGRPHARDVARALGLSERTAYRLQAGQEPTRTAALALFWATPWGWDYLDSERAYAATLAHQLAQAHADEAERLRAQLAHLERIGEFGASNAPRLQA